MNSDNSRAREAASLGVVVAWLKAAGGLENGMPLPTDAHPDVFPAAQSRGHASDEASRSGTMPRCDPVQARVRLNRSGVCFGEDAEMSATVSQPDVFLTGEGNNFFDRHVETYHSDFPPLLQKPLEFYCRYPKPDPGVLEIGCASGRNLHYLQTRRSLS